MNPVLNYFNNLRNIKKNYNKVRSSPYAALKLSLKIRYILVIVLIPSTVYLTYNMIKNYPQNGFIDSAINFVFTIALMGYLCWIVYRTIPQAKKQIEYYKKYPHTINYAPVDTKETIDQILEKIEKNKLKEIKLKEDKNGISK